MTTADAIVFAIGAIWGAGGIAGALFLVWFWWRKR